MVGAERPNQSLDRVDKVDVVDGSLKVFTYP